VIRALSPGDEDAVDAFLATRADTSMFLRSNLRAVGLGWSAPGGATFEGHWVGRSVEGSLCGVACHAWNGMLMAQDDQPDEVVRTAVRASGRPVIGIVGPVAMSRAARAALGLDDAATNLDSDEVLMRLELDRLIVPRALQEGAVTCRAAEPRDAALLAAWRHDYHVEALHEAPGDATLAIATRSIATGIERARLHVLERDGAIVATTGFNAALPDIVQIGGVWTPPALRQRGYAQAVVAGSLLDARSRGVTRAVLFADPHHPSSTLAYRRIGFADAGSYLLLTFRAPQTIS